MMIYSMVVADVKMSTAKIIDVAMVGRVTMTLMKRNLTKRRLKRLRMQKKRLRAVKLLLVGIRSRSANSNDNEI